MIYLLTAIGLTPGGDVTVHSYTQTVLRTTQIITNLEECGPCLIFANFTLSFAIHLIKKHGKTSVRVRKPQSACSLHVTRTPTHRQTRPHHIHTPTLHTHTHTPTHYKTHTYTHTQAHTTYTPPHYTHTHTSHPHTTHTHTYTHTPHTHPPHYTHTHTHTHTHYKTYT